MVRNESNSDATISEGYKIAQGVLMPVYRATLVETDDLSETVRGASGFGTGEGCSRVQDNLSDASSANSIPTPRIADT